ncbi:MAG: transketolase [Ilumatobacteraceae bacterium]
MPAAENAFPSELDALAVAVIRGLAMDAPLAARSGHQGTAMALAPLAHVMFSRVLRYDPADPSWIDRDRFILSAGHASILQYALLHLSGVALDLDDLRAFRQWGSATPGHPEAGHTAGVEVTTGPLGQGFADAVGMAIAERVLAERFGRGVVDHHTWVIAGDGCLMEGVSHEAASLAGHLGLERLVCVFDDNRITIDGSTDLTCSDDVAARFRSYGWHVEELGEIGEDLDRLEAALRSAAEPNGRPRLLILRTHIGFPSPDHTDSHAAHGLAFSAEDVTRTKVVMGIPDEPFHVPTHLVDAYRRHAAERGARARSEWTERAGHLAGDDEWVAVIEGRPVGDDWAAALPSWQPGDRVATRKAIQAALDATSTSLPGLIAGSADLTGNTGTKVTGLTAQSRSNPGGRQVFYGIREHAMGAAMVGMALHGGVLPVGGTFFVFLDYMRPAVRLAARSGATCVFVFTHDSVAVGEDGPTHQPVEHLATLRAVPDLHVVRPADANETAAAWLDAVTSSGPTVLVLSRQDVPVVTDGSAVGGGAGIVGPDPTDPQVVLIGTGSEVAVCVAAAEELRASGRRVRVVSMPSWDRFALREESERASILPAGVPTVSVEAGSTFGWSRWADTHIGIDRFGASAPGEEVLERLGISVTSVISVVERLLEGSDR